MHVVKLEKHRHKPLLGSLNPTCPGCCSLLSGSLGFLLWSGTWAYTFCTADLRDALDPRGKEAIPTLKMTKDGSLGDTDFT